MRCWKTGPPGPSHPRPIFQSASQETRVPCQRLERVCLKFCLAPSRLRSTQGSQRSSRWQGWGPEVETGFGGNDFTYRKLFHLLIGNCFITCHLLMETTVGRAPKFESSGDFLNHLVTTGLLIELYPMVPFPTLEPLKKKLSIDELARCGVA